MHQPLTIVILLGWRHEVQYSHSFVVQVVTILLTFLPVAISQQNTDDGMGETRARFQLFGEG